MTAHRMESPFDRNLSANTGKDAPHGAMQRIVKTNSPGNLYSEEGRKGWGELFRD
jgi:hypothetical protein